MTLQSRTTLKSYFITGASPSESDFGDLIDSALLVEDIVASFDSTSTTDPLAASAGKILNESVVALGLRVTELEGQEQSFASSYYTKTEVDEKIAPIDTLLTQQVVANYQSQIDNLQSQIDTIDSGGTVSTIAISNVTGLQAELNAKATITQLNDVRDSLIASINAIDTSVDLSGVNESISNIESEIDALELQIASKADTSAIPTDFYTKSEVDTKLENIELEDHQHVSADITDLGTEIQDKTNLLLSDHSSLQNNPHNVTKAQIGLSKVENLTPAEIVAQGEVGAISQLQSELDSHKGAQNPHNVTKEQVGLSDVPNVNFQSLLDAHIASENPHNIDLSFFDVYAKAEADSRTQFYIDSVRYAFTPLSNSDSAGAVGDFAYDSDNLYFKIGAIDWVKIPFSPVYIQREATQEDVDAGIATEVGEVITVNEVAVQGVSEITINNNFNITNEGDDIFQITEEGDIIQNSTTIEGDVTIAGDIISNENITINAPSTTINNLTVDGGTITNVTNIETTEFSSVNMNVTDAEVTNLSVSNIVNNGPDGKSADFEYDFITDRWVTDTPIGSFELAYVSDIPDLSNYALKSDIPTNLGGSDPEVDDGGGETDIVLDSQTGGIEKGYAFTQGAGLYADDYDIPGDQEYWAFEVSAIQNSGLVVNVGQGANNPYLRYNVAATEWQIFNGTDVYTINPYTQSEIDALLANKADVNHTHSQYALTSDLPDFSTFALLTDLEGLGGTTIINEGDTVNTTVLNQTIVQQSLTIDGTSGGAENGYAYSEYDDGTGTLVGEKYSIDYGADNTYGTADDDDTEDYFSVDASAYSNAGLTVNANLDPNPSIVYDGSVNRWLVNDGGSFGTFYLGEAEGYVAYDQSQTLTSAEQTQARSNIGAQAAGNYLTSIPSEYLTQTEGDARYLQSVPSEYLTETEGDARYYTQQEVDDLIADAIADHYNNAPHFTQQQIVAWIVAAQDGTLVTNEYSIAIGGQTGNYSLAGTASSPWSGWDQNDDYAHAVA